MTRQPNPKNMTQLLIFAIREMTHKQTPDQLREIANVLNIWADQTENDGDY